MLKTFLFTLTLAFGFSLFSPTHVSSQTVFAPPGATWRYNMYTVYPNPPYGGKQYRYVATTDTIINGWNARTMQGEIWTNGAFVPSPVMTRYVSVLGDKVYHLVDTTFELLYDFGAQPGDTIFSAVDGIFPFDNGCWSPPGGRFEFTYVIDAVGTATIDGETLRTQTVHTPNNGFFGWSITGPTDGILIERIGLKFGGTWFGGFEVTTNKGYLATLRCYEDSTIFYKGYTAGLDCDSVVATSSPDRPVFAVGPVPFDTEIRLTIPENTGKDLVFNLININGGQVLQQKVDEGDHIIYPGNLPAGFYVWQISSRGKITGAGKLIKINPR